MIVILDENLKKLGTIRKCISANRREELNGENTLDFEAILDEKMSDLLNENSIFESDDDYFDTAIFKKEANDDGTYIVEVEAEHVSYRLNNPEYDKEYFTEDGTPEYILGKILEGTGFTIGTIEFDTVETYSAQESKSRRQLLMEYVAYLKGEVKFHKFEVSILQQRGRQGVYPVIKDKDVKILSKTVNKREKDENGNPTVSYSISPITLESSPYELGDNVRLIQRKLDINEDLRVTSVEYNPYFKQDVTYTFANYENGLESAIFRINRDTLIKDKVYNGIRISPEIGFEAVLSNKLARSYFGADKMAFQVGDGTGENWYDKLYYILDTNTGSAEMYFGGKLTADAISAIEAQLDIVISETVITNVLSAETGYIAQLTVDRLLTDTKVHNYLIGDTSPIEYQKIEGKVHQLWHASTDGTQTERATNRYGEYLYWADDEYTIVTLDETDYPVITYKYNEKMLYQLSFAFGNAIEMIFGQGDGVVTDSAKGYLVKNTNNFQWRYHRSSTGDLRQISLQEDGIVLTGSTGDKGIRNIIFSPNVPTVSDMEVGEVWFQYSTS